MGRFAKYFYTFASCFFLLLLLLPFADERLHLSETKVSGELRTMAELPTFDPDSVSIFPKKFESFYNDNFGFRGTLVEWGNKIKYHVFHISPLPDKVACGQKDWLFLTGRFYEITQDIARENRYTEEGLKVAAQEWEIRKQELEKRNIHYYKASWPDKHYIYPEYLPEGMKLASSALPARCDQAAAYLKQTNSPIQIIDIRQALLEEKKKHQIYLRHDSHWNSYGAFIAYTALMNRLSVDFPALKPRPIDNFNVTWSDFRWGDLANMINIELHDTIPAFIAKTDTCKITDLPVDGYPRKTVAFRNESAKGQPKLLIFRDSYTNAMLPFLKPHFSEIILIWDTPYSIELVEKVKPDIVLEAYVTRYFR